MSVERGRKGETGDTGRVGDTGRTGDTGKTGDTGEAGRAGDTGIAGAIGRTGRVGPSGLSQRMRILLAAFGAVTLLAVAVFATVALTANNSADETETTAERNTANIAAIRHEARVRAEADCRQDETSHLADVKQLRGAYRYLLSLNEEERRTALLLANLSAIEHKARIDVAPEYCDKPNVGLPEPDPVIPKRPAQLR